MSSLTRRTSCANATHAKVNGMDIEILPHTGNIKYLGQTITFHDLMETELNNRLKAAWSTFTRHRQELTSSYYPLAHRLRLFNSTVTPCALYAAGTWTLTEPLRRKLQSCQRRMLRIIINTPRRYNTTTRSSTQSPSTSDASSTTTPCDDIDSNPPTPDDNKTDDSDTDSRTSNTSDHREPWIDYVRRSTHRAEQLMTRHGIEPWTTIQRRLVWRLAATVANHPSTRWTHQVSLWHPVFDTCRTAHRTRGRQRKRWSDDITPQLRQHLPHLHPTTTGDSDIKDTTWMATARDPVIWSILEQRYVGNSTT